MMSARHAGITPPKSLQRSFTASILWVHLSVLTIALTAGFFVLLGISRNQTIQQGENSLAYMAYQMDTLSDSLYDIRSQLMQDKDMQIYLASDRSVDAEDILLQQSVMNQLSLIIRSYSYVSSITLFQGDGPVLCVSETMQIQGKAEDEPLPIQSSDVWKGLTAHSGLTWGGQYQEMDLFLSRYRPGSSSTVVSLLLPLVDYQGGRPFSVLSVNVPAEYFSFLYSKHADYGAAVHLWGEDGSLLLSVPESSGAPEGFHLFRDTVVTSQLSRTGWHLSEGIPFSVLLYDSVPLLLAVSAIFLAAIFAAVLLSSLAGRRLLNPFQEIVEQMSPINDGNLSQRLSPQKYSELNTLVRQFNHMMERIQQLVAANESYAEEKRLLEMETLQSQINPHFLYNSLTTIRWMAAMARAENVCQALFALGNIIRPVFSQPGIFWSLDTEQTFVRNFVDIMDYRFGIKTECSFAIPGELLERPVLRFILQPLVENSFQHGLQSGMDAGRRGIIHIRARQEDSWLDIYVQDNGQGMDGQSLIRLNERLQKGTTDPPAAEPRTGIGLSNVNRRILLQYGEGSGLSVWSQAGQGTTVRIRMRPEPVPPKPSTSH
jgi:two-component system sensor histidine kinase YesM